MATWKDLSSSLIMQISSSSLRNASNVGAVGDYCFRVGDYCFRVGDYCFRVGVYCEWVGALFIH